MNYGIWHDLKASLRRLRTSPVFTVFATVSLALGIGVTTAVYSAVEVMLWPSLSLPDAARIVFVAIPTQTNDAIWRSAMSASDFADFVQAQTCFSTVASSRVFSQPLSGAAVSEVIGGEAVSGGYFRTLGVNALTGRVIEPQDDERASDVAVLRYQYWRDRFGGDPDIVGSSIRLGHRSFVIIGIAPQSFNGLTSQATSITDVWIPAATASSWDSNLEKVRSRSNRNLTVAGRLAAKRTLADAATQLSTIAKRLDDEFPLNRLGSTGTVGTPARRAWIPKSASDSDASDASRRLGTVIVAVVALVLLVACTNLANLTLARGTLLQRELAVRSALGASRIRLVRAQCIEAAVIALSGGFTGLILARGLTVVLLNLAPTQRIGAQNHQGLSLTALIVAGLAVLLSLFVFGLEPALQITAKRSLAGQLLSDSRVFGTPNRTRQRRFLRWQVATSACFFLVVAVLVRNLVIDVDPAHRVDLSHLAVVTVNFGVLGWTQDRARRALADTLESLGHQPDIESVGIYSGLGHRTPLASLDPLLPGRTRVEGYMLSSSPETLKVLNIPLIQGRQFDASDAPTGPLVTMITEHTARNMFGRTDVVGAHAALKVPDTGSYEDVIVIGVVADRDCGQLFRRDDDVIYLPWQQHYEPKVTILARTKNDPGRAVRTVQASLQQADPEASMVAAGRGPIMLAGKYLAARFVAIVATCLGGLTLMLAAVGLYGVQSQYVESRTGELGLRFALGATRPGIERMVLLDGFRPVFEGLLLGFVLGVLARFVVRAILVAPIAIFDVFSFAVTPIPLFMAAFLACYLPARRAASVDPNIALRHL